MKNKIVMLLAAVLLTTVAAVGQTTSRWGVTAGVNYNQVHFKQSDILPTKRQAGPILGVTGEMNFAGAGFGVDGSILYSLRQGKVDYGSKLAWSSIGAGNERVSMHFIDVPLHLMFKYHNLGGTETTFMPLVYAGPQFSFLLHGNNTGLNDYKRVHVYVDMGVGCELFERWQVRAGYHFSVGQTFHTKLLDDNVAKNRCWYATLTYFLK